MDSDSFLMICVSFLLVKIWFFVTKRLNRNTQKSLTIFWPCHAHFESRVSRSFRSLVTPHNLTDLSLNIWISRNWNIMLLKDFITFDKYLWKKMSITNVLGNGISHIFQINTNVSFHTYLFNLAFRNDGSRIFSTSKTIWTPSSWAFRNGMSRYFRIKKC